MVHKVSQGQGVHGFLTGLVSGFAKAQSTYRSYRRCLNLFGRQCRRRGGGVAIEGTYLVLSQLQDVAWDATEGLDMDDMELSDDPFKPIVEVLDRLFQHEEEVEPPERCHEFFEKFNRERGEELEAYLVRHGNHAEKAQRVAGQSVQSPDSNAKDSILKDGINYLDNFEYDDGGDDGIYYNDEVYCYQDDDGNHCDPEYDEAIDEIEHTGDANEDIPQEVDEASIAVEDAYINYLDSREKMMELALSRGFYPVVNQIPVDYQIHDTVNFVSQAAGSAIMDSGATRKIVDYLSLKTMEPEIDRENKDFWFGDGAMVRSLFRVHLPVCVGKIWRQLIVHVLPGHTHTPLLLARPDFDAWGIVVNYGKKSVMIGKFEVKPAFTPTGHYMLNIFDDLKDVMNFDELYNKEIEGDTVIPSLTLSLWTLCPILGPTMMSKCKRSWPKSVSSSPTPRAKIMSEG
eukprot:s3600_g10.t1